MQKQKFGVMSSDTLFVESILVPPENEKWHIDVSQPEHTAMHYVTRRCHKMQKHKFDVTCLDALFMETATVTPEHEQ
jgi:hypothetical protein